MYKTIGELLKEYGKGCKVRRVDWEKGVYVILLCEFQDQIFVKDPDPPESDFYHSRNMEWEVYKEKVMVKKWQFEFVDANNFFKRTLYHYKSKQDAESTKSSSHKAFRKLESTMIEVEEDA